MHTVLLPLSFDRKRMEARTRYAQAHPVPRIKERKLNWEKVIGVATPFMGALAFVALYGVVGKMDYDDALATAQAVEAHRKHIVCSAAVDPAIQARYGVTAAQITVENC